jgi:dienelactone hydrolase
VGIGGAVVAAAVAFGVVAAGRFPGGADEGPVGSASARSSASTTRTTVPRVTTTTGPAAAAPVSTAAPLTRAPTGRTHAVGTSALTFVDTSRPTSPNGDFGGAPTRTLPTTFWYPADGAVDAAPQAGAPPDRAHGPYPLVLFAHGYDVTPDFYAPLLERWAAAGYVVAAPTFPILSGTPGGASHVDYVETFADASFVISQVLALGSDQPLHGLVDPARIGVAGHSDGEVIAFAEGYLACCRDPRVRTVIAMAGDLSNANNPSVPDTGIPILHIMETGDEYDPYERSIAWDRENLTPPRWMLTLSSTHVPPYTEPGDPAFELVSRVTVDYLDATLKSDPDALTKMTREVSAAPAVGTLEH